MCPITHLINAIQPRLALAYDNRDLKTAAEIACIIHNLYDTRRSLAMSAVLSARV